jgi:RNA polymerase sigma factor (sigma-70 family)
MTAEVLTLRGAIDGLPTEQRQVIELKYLVGMTNDEVAAAMETTPGAVNARQWRALKALAEILEERS